MKHTTPHPERTMLEDIFDEDDGRESWADQFDREDVECDNYAPLTDEELALLETWRLTAAGEWC